jgi:hypothetical protein
MNTPDFTEHPKKKDDVARKKEVKEEEAGSGNSITDSVAC